MLIHPWDTATEEAEWRDCLAADELLVHPARPNPVWPHLEAAREVRPVVVEGRSAR